MKYTVNHPLKFRNSIDHTGKFTIMGVIPAFFLGLVQVIVTILVELGVMLYLCTQDDVMTILIKCIAMSRVARFDDMYALNLRNSKILSAVGKKLIIQNKRYML